MQMNLISNDLELIPPFSPCMQRFKNVWSTHHCRPSGIKMTKENGQPEKPVGSTIS